MKEGEDPLKAYERAEEETICDSSVILRREEILNRMDEVEDALDQAEHEVMDGGELFDAREALAALRRKYTKEG